MLIGAVGIAVEEWNRQHNDDANKVMVFMPVNLRPAEWSTDLVSNMFSYVSVSTMRRDRTDLAAAAKAVAEQTAPIRRAARAGGTQDLLRLISPLPLGVKRRMPGLLTLTGNRFVDMALCPIWAGQTTWRRSLATIPAIPLHASVLDRCGDTVGVIAAGVTCIRPAASPLHAGEEPEIGWRTCSSPPH